MRLKMVMGVLLIYPLFPKSLWSFEKTLALAERKALLSPLSLITVAAILPLQKKNATTPFMLIITFFVVGFMLSSLIEYWIHRFMHIFPWFGTVTLHYKHHYEESYGIWQDFKSYSQLVFLFCPMFVISWSAGINTSLGAIVFAAFAAYTHQLQHQNPTKCFWMKVPVHYLHHKYSCQYNFGLSVDWWDIVFKTYRPNQQFSGGQGWGQPSDQPQRQAKSIDI